MEQAPALVQIGIESALQEDVAEMIEALDSYLGSLYPSHSNYLLSLDSLMGENVGFLVTRVDGAAAGCGALVLDDPGYAEIERMYVKPGARRLGIGAAMLREIEDLARKEKRSCIRLETGVYQPEALALYRRAGYVDRGPFSDYPLDPLSVFMEKSL